MIALSILVWGLQYVSRSIGVLGQSTTAKCTFDQWMFNSLDQSPCLVSSYLLTPCSSQAASFVFPLENGFHYNTPTSDPSSATPCRCNTVFYSMISACATCQGQGLFTVPWSTYSLNCSSVYIQQYPEPIPPGTAVPAWAYMDVRTTDDFNAIEAQRIQEEGLPESTAVSAAGPTATGSRTGGSTSSPTTLPPNSNDGDNGSGDDNSSKKSTNIAPIVGGVVGGVVGVLAIALAIFFWLRHRRNAARNAPTGPLDLTAGEDAQFVEKPLDFDQGVPPSATGPKVYNPDDPSTFPSPSDNQGASSHGSTTLYPTSPTDAHLSTVPYAYPAPDPYRQSMTAHTTAAYKGVPEL
ncbi:hypothetical protein C8Q77DRAFT_395673 [Trametes polyzona]|nr:hypothetical protein C8Q77DRAFT_395673 [Trametes polyzona]